VWNSRYFKKILLKLAASLCGVAKNVATHLPALLFWEQAGSIATRIFNFYMEIFKLQPVISPNELIIVNLFSG